MKKQKTSMSLFKWVVTVLHLTFIALAVIGVFKVYHNPYYAQGLGWLKTARYEDTKMFASQLQGDVDLIFDYVRYQQYLEKDGQVDLSTDVLQILYAPGDERYCDLTELINYGASVGLYLTDTYDLREPEVEPVGEAYEVLWKFTDEDVVGKEPGEEKATLYQLARESLRILGNYYKVVNVLNNQNSNLYYNIVYKDFYGKYVTQFSNISDDMDEVVEQKGYEEVDDVLMDMGRYMRITGENSQVDTNLTFPLENTISQLEACNMNNNNDYYMTLGVDTTYKRGDAYQAAAAEYQANRQGMLSGLFMAGLGFFGCLLTLFLMVLQTGKQEFGGEIVLSGADTWPTELALIFWSAVTMLAFYLMQNYGAKLLHMVLPMEKRELGYRVSGMVVVYLCALVGGLSLYRRYRRSQLWGNSLLRMLALQMQEYVGHRNETFRMAAAYGGYLLVNLLVGGLAFMAYEYLTEGYLLAALVCLGIVWVVFSLWIFHLLFRRAIQEDRIGEALSKIAGGDTAVQMDPDKFSGKPKLLAQAINNISVGLEKALQEQVKSERLKTDLITNVSHDIKTPLTSIINYVDLMKRENIQNPKILGYLEVLDQKSQRLKNLTEDLVEASKASSGNLNLELTTIDLVELVNQTNGEFEEKFSTRNLTLVMKLPELAAPIHADGRRLWRVLENLYNNAFKYAMQGSRVYVDVFVEESQAVFLMKNVSEYPLNIKPDELTERFVRGDVSRTTEGSGLGLSIAKSLTELQKGHFVISIDGDLFKVKVSFPLAAE